MPIKKYNPTSPGRRQMSTLTFEEITKSKPEKSLTKMLKSRSGRNNTGEITVRHRGSGHKRMYRIIDFKRTDKMNIEGKVIAIEYDPYRTSFIILVQYKDSEKRYHIAPQGIQVGAKIITAEKAKIRIGNHTQLKNIPVGYNIHNVELHEGKGGQMGRSAGSALRLVAVEGDHAQIAMPSGEIRLVSKLCFATIGQVGNIDHNNVTIGKAGRNRHRGKRPQVRGSAMNPVDHPHGGGEGRSPIGLKHPKTPWGLPALGVKTRRRHYTDKMIIQDRRHKVTAQ